MELDVARCRQINDWLAGVELPPEITAVWAEAHLDEPGYHLLMSAPSQPDVGRAGETVAGGVSAHLPTTPISRDGLVADIMAAFIMRAVHEAVEWVKVDGLRFAEPHPINRYSPGMEMWRWLATRCRDLVEDYTLAFPGPHRAHPYLLNG